PVGQLYMSGQSDVVGQDDIAAQLTIMRYVYVRHDPIVVANASHASILTSTDIESHEFAYRIAIANFQARSFTCVFLVLWRRTDRRKVDNRIVATFAGMTFDDDMRTDFSTCPYHHVRSNHRVRTHFDRVRELRLGINDGSRMYQCHGYSV